MRLLNWQLLTIALLAYIAIAAGGYYLLLDPQPSGLVASEIALASLFGIGPRPIEVSQQHSAALWFDMAALTIGFLLRVTSLGMIAASFVFRAQEKSLQIYRIRKEEPDTTQLWLNSRRN